MDDVAGHDGVGGVDFSDREKAVAWPKTQSIQVRCVISSRAALRVCASICVEGENDFSQLALPTLRAILASAAQGSRKHAEIYHLGTAARHAYFSVPQFIRSAQPDDPAKGAVYFAVRSAEAAADSAFSSSGDTFAAVRGSAEAAAKSSGSNGQSAARAHLFAAASKDTTHGEVWSYRRPLWFDGEIPKAVAKNHKTFTEMLNADRSVWGFWHDWYLAMWEGRFTDWDLAIEVAKIRDDVWEQGAEAVAVEIEKVRAKLLDTALPQAEIVEFNPQTLRFSARPITVEKTDLIGATLQQVEDSLEDVLASTSNGLSSSSREVRVIERTIRKYGNNPQQIEMGFVSAHAGLTRQIMVSELPASEENLALQSALEEGAIAIRATHPDVAENRAILTKRKFAELTQEQKHELADALPVLRAISDEALADDWEHDIPALINTSMGPLPSGAPALPAADEATRIFSRAAKISILLRSSEVIHAIDKGAPYKAARIVLTVGGLVTLGWTLMALI